MSANSIKEYMDKIPDGWKYRWCESPCCACMGCANRSGGLQQANYTKKEWEDFLKNKVAINAKV